MREIELLAPGGDVDALKAAIFAGADAVYCGLDKFNARNRAKNITYEELKGIIRLAHKNNCKVFLTLNIIVIDNEFPSLIKLLNKLANTNIDGVIVQDLGVFYLLSKYYKRIQIHASTQLTTHNEGQIHFLQKLNATRINLSRELNIQEITYLARVGLQQHILSEVFVHGSYCISFSGTCYMSSVQNGKSGNRGQCSQPCRDRYLTTSVQKNYPLNLKDNSAFFDLKELIKAGVYSLKIEGRIKEYEYVYTVVNSWRKQIDSVQNHNKLLTDNSDLYKVFNRDFSNAFLKGNINSDMFIDNPMTNSGKHYSEENINIEKREQGLTDLYSQKAQTRKYIKNEIDKLSILPTPIAITFAGNINEPLKITIKSSEKSFIIFSESKLANTGLEALNQKILLKKFNTINDTNYFIEHLVFKNNNEKLYLPFSELTTIKKKILTILNKSSEYNEPVKINLLKKTQALSAKPTLAVLISSLNDLNFCAETNTEIHFQLPDSLKNKVNEFVELFSKNDNLIPVFPTILIGDDYADAVKLLQQVNPKRIITNNTGIAFEASKLGISWIAGPYLNLVNSYSLLCLKEMFNCSGAFISNEISKTQLRGIKNPADFKLYYSIYHPIEMMTSRQCLFHQVTGCEKKKIDQSCIQDCQKSASISNQKNNSYLIKKTKRNYHRIYNEINYLNLEVIKDFSNLFSTYSIDLRDIKTATDLTLKKSQLISLFKNHLEGNSNSYNKLIENIQPTSNKQYTKGV